MTKRIFAAALTAATLLAPAAFAASADASDPRIAPLVQCKQEMNLPGTLKIAQRGDSFVAVAGGRISTADARAVNDCVAIRAGKRLRSSDGYPYYASHRSCYRQAPILYRGNMYCFRGR